MKTEMISTAELEFDFYNSKLAVVCVDNTQLINNRITSKWK
jgi:hypothetical protein